MEDVIDLISLDSVPHSSPRKLAKKSEVDDQEMVEDRPSKKRKLAEFDKQKYLNDYDLEQQMIMAMSQPGVVVPVSVQPPKKKVKPNFTGGKKTDQKAELPAK